MPRLAALLLLPVLAACAAASTGATFRSGVAPTAFERPPYYAGASAAAVSGGGRVAHLPIAYQRGATQSPIFEPEGGAGSPIGALVAEMNAWLDSSGTAAGAAAGARIAPPRGTPPDVRFGCETDASGDCDEDPPGGLTDERRRVRIEVGRPSPEWAAALAPTLDSAGADRALLVTLEVAQLWPRQKNLLGAKEVELGTGHSQQVPWLTALDRPMMVLQLTGALIGRDGRAIRIGAEGLYAKRTNLLTGSFGAQSLLGDEDVERLRTLRRDDLPGRPLVWQAALATLVRQLVGGE